MRYSLGFPLLALTALCVACSQGGGDEVPAVAEGEELIACAVDGASELKEVCAVERSRSEGVLYLTVRHPNGAFRRFEVLDDGRGLAVADGSQQAVVRYPDGFAELAVGNDLYRFPATKVDHAEQP